MTISSTISVKYNLTYITLYFPAINLVFHRHRGKTEWPAQRVVGSQALPPHHSASRNYNLKYQS